MKRVIPRDLFNDANLLKCIGQVCLAIHDNDLMLGVDYNDEPFDIGMNPGDGSTFVANMSFFTFSGQSIYFTRPLNSRDPFPLYAQNDDGEVAKVFDSEGRILREFKEMVSNTQRSEQ